MNILYLHTHDLGDWTGIDGQPVETPNLDTLGLQSLRFSNAFANAPTCSPSRAALLTGQYPHCTGMLGLAHRGFTLSHPENHLANLLKAAGYDATLAGIQHEFHGADPEGYPYDTCIGIPGRKEGESMNEFQRRRDLQTAEAGSQWLDKRRADNPFFLSVGFFQPHRPLPETEDDVEFALHDTPQSLPKTEAVREDFRKLKGSIRLLDTACGIIIDALKRNGFWENTLILFTSDHGIAFPEHKCTLKDAGCKVSLFLRNPEMPETHGKVIDQVVSHIDVLPTLMDWLNLDMPGHVQGRSLNPLIQGKPSDHDPVHFAEVNYHAAYQPMRSIRNDKHLFIEHFLPEPGQPLANVDDCLSKTEWIAASGHLVTSRYELYDLEKDPLQACNLAGLNGTRLIQQNLHEQLHSWMIETSDPLIEGPLQRPPQARINTRESISPHEELYEDSVV